MSETLHFRVSSGLKNIIGRELINDKNIAIFELVKNAYDAGAKRARIQFKDLGSPSASIIISDDGCGMSKEDIIQKWLFVAYSEKRNPSYRDKIKRTVAGAKGVGRFSCDRLGEQVCLRSKTTGEDTVHKVTISWNDFERDSKDNFTDINVQYDFVIKKNAKSGTSICISGLREEWTRTDLLELKKSLTKLVNPSATTGYDPFEVILDVKSELEKDAQFIDEREKVNGPIVNNIFDVINQKTTKILVSISPNGKTITTTLNDRGSFLFETIEKNEYSLCDVTCTLYYLNRIAKANFTRKMGVEAVNYGSIFVYKNGFRVFPYGDPGSDFFDIDQRKQQGYKRFLGTRELIGQIEIKGEKNNLIETSSRNNGFIASPHLDELKQFFMEYVLKPLEKYVVNIVQWGDTEDLFDPSVDIGSFSNIIENIIRKIKYRSKAESFISIRCNEDLLNTIIERRKELSSPTEQLQKFAEASNDPQLIKHVAQVTSRTKELEKRVEHANQEAEKAQARLDSAHAELETARKQVGLLSARADLTAQDAISAMHIMKGYADAIDSNIQEILEIIEDDRIDNSSLRPLLDSISRICKKIMNSYNLVMRTKYSADSDEVYTDLIQFVSQYCAEFSGSLKIRVENPSDIVAKVSFNPLEFSIILDNLIDNSRKANADNLVFRFEKEGSKLLLRCRDNGYGLKQGVDEKRLFEPGYSTTSGSGIGLNTIKKYIEKRGGEIAFNPEYIHGFEVDLYIV